MLILTRKLNESIIIGKNICVTVVNIGRRRVKLNINAPYLIPVHRKEVLERVLIDIERFDREGWPGEESAEGEEESGKE